MATVTKKYAVLQNVNIDGLSFDIIKEVRVFDTEKEGLEFIESRYIWGDGKCWEYEYYIVPKYTVKGERR